MSKKASSNGICGKPLPGRIEECRFYSTKRAEELTGFAKSTFKEYKKNGFFGPGEWLDSGAIDGSAMVHIRGEALLRLLKTTRPKAKKGDSKKATAEYVFESRHVLTLTCEPCDSYEAEVRSDRVYATPLAAYLLGRAKTYMSRLTKGLDISPDEVRELSRSVGHSLNYYEGGALLRCAEKRGITLKAVPIPELTKEAPGKALKAAPVPGLTEEASDNAPRAGETPMEPDEIRFYGANDHPRIRFSEAISLRIHEGGLNECGWRWDPLLHELIILLDKAGKLPPKYSPCSSVTIRCKGHSVYIENGGWVRTVFDKHGLAREEKMIRFRFSEKTAPDYPGSILLRLGERMEGPAAGPVDSIALFNEK